MDRIYGKVFVMVNWEAMWNEGRFFTGRKWCSMGERGIYSGIDVPLPNGEHGGAGGRQWKDC